MKVNIDTAELFKVVWVKELVFCVPQVSICSLFSSDSSETGLGKENEAPQSQGA